MSTKATTSPLLKLVGFIALFLLSVISVSYFSSGEDSVTQGNNSKGGGENNNAQEEPVDDSRVAADVRELFARLDRLSTQLNDGGASTDSKTRFEGLSEEQVLELVKNHLQTTQGSRSMVVDKSTDDALAEDNFVVQELSEGRESTVFDGIQQYSDSENGLSVSLGEDYVISSEKSADEGDPNEIEWLEPASSGGSESLLESLMGDDGEAVLDFEQTDEQVQKDAHIHYASMDKHTVLYDATSLNALVGVVPMNESIKSPFRFTVEIGEQNMATSGIYMPYLSLMRLSGYARGEWSTGCVSGVITDVTYIFDDEMIGVIKTSDEVKTGVDQGQIGILVDEFGDPCIRGEKYSSLTEYASVAGGLNFFATAGEALKESNFQSTASATGEVTKTFDGDLLSVALGAGASGGIDSVSQIIAQRYSNVRDIVVAPPGRYHIQLTKQLDIFYNPEGFKLKNDKFEQQLYDYLEEKELANND